MRKAGQDHFKMTQHVLVPLRNFLPMKVATHKCAPIHSLSAMVDQLVLQPSQALQCLHAQSSLNCSQHQGMKTVA
jgi:hypothetical protein